MKPYLLHLLALLLLLNLSGLALAATPSATDPAVATASLGEALNPDGTLRPGANGSFDARHFRMCTAPDGRPVFRPAGVAGPGDERWADGFGLPNGADSQVQVVVRAGNNIYIGGSFSVIGNTPANGVAKWNGTAWSALGAGVKAIGAVGAIRVYALAVAGNGNVYIGGEFTQAGGVAANYVARWNGTVWSPLGTGAANGTNGTVISLAVASNGDVYVGGQFSQAGGAGATNIAKWNGTAWSPLGTSTANGVNAAALALAVAGNGDVYVGGFFTQAGGVAANHVARWNGTTWTSLGTGTANGVNNAMNTAGVYALAVAGTGDVYAAGHFDQAGGVGANNVARWDGTTWSPLGIGVVNGTDGNINTLAVSSTGEVYAGGIFTQAGGVIANYVARWNGTAWSPLGTGAANGVSTQVFALAVAASGDVYAGGQFTLAGGMAANYVARWNGTAWSLPLGTGATNGVGTAIDALAVAGNGDVYVGGQFSQVGGIAANCVARWNGTAWSSLGTGPANGVNSGVDALAVASNGDVYAAGNFTQAGGITANKVARWDGTAWSSLGTGPANGVSGPSVYALAVAGNGDVYVGGQFSQVGGIAANCVARWNGTAWNALGVGTGTVYVLAVAGNGDVYVGGGFTYAGGVAANYVARWNGTTWNALGSGVNSTVRALVVSGTGDVYVGGAFTQAGGAAASHVARWNGTAWSPLGSTLNQSVYALAVASTGDLYVGGGFTQANGTGMNRITRWDGATWNSLGSGLNDAVNAFAIGPNGKLYAGGSFTTTGDDSKAMAHFGIYDPNAVLATKAPTATPAAQLFPNPAHGTATLRLPAGAPRQPLLLTDALGRPVRRYPAPAAADAELDLRGLPAGVYSVRCGQLSQRLVVE